MPFADAAGASGACGSAAYRNETLAWQQVAELSYDSFMMRMRTRS